MAFEEFERELRRTWGDEAAGVRHEIYFAGRRGRGWRQVARALAALVRDAWLCWRLPAAPATLEGILAVVSLAGASGWGSLAALVPVAATVVAHPRLRRMPSRHGRLPRRPMLAAWRGAAAAFRLAGRGLPAGISPWTIRCAVARQRLWRAVWARTLEDGKVAALLLHNDFDIFAAAAVAAAGERRIPTICVQHGLPTDEFFPCRADVQLVWGESSRAVYGARGVPTDGLVIGTPRRPAGLDGRGDPAHPAASPDHLLLLSQAHTPVFGRPLAADLLALASALAGALAPEEFTILLHPEETRLGHPYGEALRGRCRHAPHPALDAMSPQAAPALVVGFCSTALVEAALAGHYVLGIDWTVPAGAGALAVGTPPRRAGDAAAVLADYVRLRVAPSFRADWRRRQAAWLDATLAPLASNWLDICLARAASHATPARRIG